MHNLRSKIIGLGVMVTLMVAMFAVPASAALTTVYLDDPQNTGTSLSVQFPDFVTAFLADPTAQICQVWARSTKKGVRADNNVADFSAYVSAFMGDPVAAGTWESYGKSAGAVLMTIPEQVKDLSANGAISSIVRNPDHIYQQLVTIVGNVATIQYNPATNAYTATINSGHGSDTLLDLLNTTDIVNAILTPGSVTIGGKQITLASQDVDGVIAQLSSLKDSLTQLAGKTDFTTVTLNDLKGKTITATDRGTTVSLTLAQ